jgi:hypothetical protein
MVLRRNGLSSQYQFEVPLAPPVDDEVEEVDEFKVEVAVDVADEIIVDDGETERIDEGDVCVESTDADSEDDVGDAKRGESGDVGLRFRVSGAGLRPPAPSSRDPSGIPTRPTGAAAAIPVGDEADAAGCAKGEPPKSTQVPEAVPVTPPPSKIEVDGGVGPTTDPVPGSMPAIAFPKPEAAADVAPVIDPSIADETPVVELANP